MISEWPLALEDRLSWVIDPNYERENQKREEHLRYLVIDHLLKFFVTREMLWLACNIWFLGGSTIKSILKITRIYKNFTLFLFSPASFLSLSLSIYLSLFLSLPLSLSLYIYIVQWVKFFTTTLSQTSSNTSRSSMFTSRQLPKD